MCEQQNTDCCTASGIFQRLCRALSDGSGDVEKRSREFSALKTNHERVDFSYKLLQSYGLFPDFLKRCKTRESAFALRKEGNDLFKTKDDELALIKYTESIAQAPIESEDFALAVANRSAVLFERKLFRECLKDISLALSGNYPKHLREKLLQRKEKAQLRQSNQPKFRYHEDAPNLTYPPNQFIECASDCVKINKKEILGRHIIATNDVKVGDVVAIEKPFAKILLPKYFLTHCYHCLRPSYILIPCSNCPLVLFCKENCRRTAWDSYHRHECPILAALITLDVNKLTLVALRICISIEPEYNNINKFNCGDNEIYRSQNYAEIHNLVANTDLRTVSDLFDRAVTAAIIFELLDKNTDFFGGKEYDSKKTFKELLLFHMQTGPSNFHEISELVRTNEGVFKVEEIGAGAYAFLSMLNHSCCPNVVRHCYGSSIVVRALRPIERGQQLFDNYGYHHAVMSKTERQQHLKKQYCFVCKCEACTENWPLYHDLPIKNVDISISEEQITKLRSGNSEVVQSILINLQQTAHALELLKPCKELADVQEIIKQCYAIFGNKRIRF